MYQILQRALSNTLQSWQTPFSKSYNYIKNNRQKKKTASFNATFTDKKKSHNK